ncbi:MAG: hypothetical protein JNM18_09345 [Planctomycetaceae bacterium]|nr:hypothetical protein [Planctomycetaceae bacterium]
MIATAEKSERTNQRMTGYERAMMYAMAANTGLWKSKIASLTTDSFCLEIMPPLVIVKPQDTKNGKKAK